jgi:hypothetical protein
MERRKWASLTGFGGGSQLAAAMGGRRCIVAEMRDKVRDENELGLGQGANGGGFCSRENAARPSDQNGRTRSTGPNSA